MSDTVTVIIPTWNRAATLGAAIRSTLCQTHPPLEVLVCDDGSEDRSEEIVRSFGDPRVRWLAGPRGGRPAIPRNRGIMQSRGEWIAFLDSDDQWERDKLQKQLLAARRAGLMAACSNAIRFVPEYGALGPLLHWSKDHVTFLDLLSSNQVICSSALIHRSLIGDVTGFPEAKELKALEDYALWLRVAARTRFAYVSEPLVIYRDEPNASVRADSIAPRLHKQTVLRDFLGWARSHAPAKLPVYFAQIAVQSAWDVAIRTIGRLEGAASRALSRRSPMKDGH